MGINTIEKATPIIRWTAGSSPAPTAFAGHINRDVKTKPRYMASLRACYEHDKGRKRKEAVTGDRTSPTEDTMKRYLAFYGDNYYPNGGMDDFVGSYDTVDEAKGAIEVEHVKRTRHPNSWKDSEMWAHIYDYETDSEVCKMHGGLTDWLHNEQL